MRYWDSSALIPLLVEQAATEAMRAMVREDPAVASWWATSVECVSALARLHRDERLAASDLAESVGRLRAAASHWAVVTPSDAVREQAIRLVRVHPLRAADAMQLAAAIVASDFQPGDLEFVSLDARQLEAAEKEGFSVISS
mgnify:FL=1